MYELMDVKETVRVTVQFLTLEPSLPRVCGDGVPTSSFFKLQRKYQDYGVVEKERL